MTKVIVGMSGGVDSAVAAYLLKQQGYEVLGVTLRVWGSDDEDSRCCEIDEARRTCGILDIKYHPHNCTMLFDENVVRPFVDDYLQGLTPNPCIECNRYVKWAKLMELADVFGADYVATGHYAFVDHLENGRYTVRMADHTAKDQTYMLYKLTQEQLARTLMPLGGYTKDEVRQIARDAGLPCADKEDSQEICFVTEGRYTDFIGEHTDRVLPGEGDFVDMDGNVLGKHKGIHPMALGDGPLWNENNPMESMFSVYSTSAVGILGAIVETTNVEGVLRLNCNATDFYASRPYPVYLMYNPFDVVKSVAYKIGDGGRKDLFDIVSRRYVAKSVCRSARILIEPDSSAVIVELPAGSVIKADENGNLTVNENIIAYNEKNN